MSLDQDATVLVAGGGGFIGGHLVGRLLADGVRHVRGVDIKPPDAWYQRWPAAENLCLDLREKEAAFAATDGAATVLNLACDMGGMGFIESHKALCMISSLINTHLLMGAQAQGAGRYLFASSACVYAEEHQRGTEAKKLREDDVYPAMPEDGYGWEKLFGERMCRHFREDFGLSMRVARLHNVFGPNGTYDGGREKAPAAICRKVIAAKQGGRHEIEIWGDGKQSRSFLYIDDALEGLMRLLAADHEEPINLGSEHAISIDDLVGIVEAIAGITLSRHYNLDAPQGVRGRSSDNTLLRQVTGWEPEISLEDGLARTYAWIEEQMTT
jgi:nucleoside-diphosphate-sugar epimerase